MCRAILVHLKACIKDLLFTLSLNIVWNVFVFYSRQPLCLEGFYLELRGYIYLCLKILSTIDLCICLGKPRQETYFLYCLKITGKKTVPRE